MLQSVSPRPSRYAAQVYAALSREGFDDQQIGRIMDVLKDEFGSGALWDRIYDAKEDPVPYRVDDLVDALHEAFDVNLLPRCEKIEGQDIGLGWTRNPESARRCDGVAGHHPGICGNHSYGCTDGEWSARGVLS